MAAVKLKENMDFDTKAVYQHVKNYLPSYARPRFVRLQVRKVLLNTFITHNNSWIRLNMSLFVWQDAVVVTGTFKQIKVKLGQEGFDPDAISDPLFYLEDNNNYVPMTQQIFNSITDGKIRL